MKQLTNNPNIPIAFCFDLGDDTSTCKLGRTHLMVAASDDFSAIQEF